MQNKNAGENNKNGRKNDGRFHALVLFAQVDYLDNNRCGSVNIYNDKCNKFKFKTKRAT